MRLYAYNHGNEAKRAWIGRGPMIEKHTGEMLFHCWQHDDRQRAYKQFDSIVKRGLLLTINSNQLDSFKFVGNGGLQNMDVMQKARACFTEIPLHLLGTHSYGHFAIGFRRKTIVDWGGLPAWYRAGSANLNRAMSGVSA
jgi:hypothetical protein